MPSAPAVSVGTPEIARKMLELLKKYFNNIKSHNICCRHDPKVHEAIRSLLKKMNINIIECEFSGTKSICCGDNFYGHVPDEQVEKRIKFRAEQFPCDDIIVYCIGCISAMEAGGKRPRYLPDLLFNKDTEKMNENLYEYHSKLQGYIDAH